MHGNVYRWVAQVEVGDIREAEAHLEAASRIADELRQPAQLWMVCATRAMLALAVGRLTEAEELVEQAFALGERAQPEQAIPVYRLQGYALCDFLGRLEEVESAICDLVAEYPARPVFRCALAHLQALLGRTEDARRELKDLARDAFSLFPSTWSGFSV